MNTLTFQMKNLISGDIKRLDNILNAIKGNQSKKKHIYNYLKAQRPDLKSILLSLNDISDQLKLLLLIYKVMPRKILKNSIFYSFTFLSTNIKTNYEMRSKIFLLEVNNDNLKVFGSRIINFAYKNIKLNSISSPKNLEAGSNNGAFIFFNDKDIKIFISVDVIIISYRSIIKTEVNHMNRDKNTKKKYYELVFHFKGDGMKVSIGDNINEKIISKLIINGVNVENNIIEEPYSGKSNNVSNTDENIKIINGQQSSSNDYKAFIPIKDIQIGSFKNNRVNNLNYKNSEFKERRMKISENFMITATRGIENPRIKENLVGKIEGSCPNADKSLSNNFELKPDSDARNRMNELKRFNEIVQNNNLFSSKKHDEDLCVRNENTQDLFSAENISKEKFENKNVSKSEFSLEDDLGSFSFQNLNQVEFLTENNLLNLEIDGSLTNGKNNRSLTIQKNNQSLINGKNNQSLTNGKNDDSYSSNEFLDHSEINKTPDKKQLLFYDNLMSSKKESSGHRQTKNINSYDSISKRITKMAVNESIGAARNSLSISDSFSRSITYTKKNKINQDIRACEQKYANKLKKKGDIWMPVGHKIIKNKIKEGLRNMMELFDEDDKISIQRKNRDRYSNILEVFENMRNLEMDYSAVENEFRKFMDSKKNFLHSWMSEHIQTLEKIFEGLIFVIKGMKTSYFLHKRTRIIEIADRIVKV